MAKSIILFVLFLTLGGGAFSQSGKLVAIVDHLNIRENPDLSATVVGQVREGEKLTSLGDESDFYQVITLRGKKITARWKKVIVPGTEKTGWVFGGAVESEKAIVYVGKTRKYKNLSEALDAYPKGGVYIKMDSGIYEKDNEVWVRGNDLVIEGVGHVELHCRELYANVMWITGRNITVRNLHMKHHNPGNPEDQNCSGRVIGLDNASDILIEDCDINGCGLVGVHDNLGNERVTLRNNYIHYNSLAPFGDIDGNIWMEEVEDHPVFIFDGNRVENNGPGRVPETEGKTE